MNVNLVQSTIPWKRGLITAPFDSGPSDFLMHRFLIKAFCKHDPISTIIDRLPQLSTLFYTYCGMFDNDILQKEYDGYRVYTQSKRVTSVRWIDLSMLVHPVYTYTMVPK